MASSVSALSLSVASCIISGPAEEEKTTEKTPEKVQSIAKRLFCIYPSCTKTFENITCLKQHKEEHKLIASLSIYKHRLGINPYPCPYISVCGKRFVTNMDLKRHLKVSHQRQVTPQ